MDKCQAPFFWVNKLTSDLYAMEANSILLNAEKPIIMPQVDDTGWMHPLDPSWTFSPFLWPCTPVSESTWVSQLNIQGALWEDEE